MEDGLKHNLHKMYEVLEAYARPCQDPNLICNVTMFRVRRREVFEVVRGIMERMGETRGRLFDYDGIS